MAITFVEFLDTNWLMQEATVAFNEFEDEGDVLISTTNSSRQDGKRWMLSYEHGIEIPAATKILPQHVQVFLELDTDAWNGFDGLTDPMRWPLAVGVGYTEDANDSHFQIVVNDTNVFLFYQGSADASSETIKKALISNTAIGQMVDVDLETLKIVVVLTAYGTGTPPGGGGNTDPDAAAGGGIIVP